MRRLILLSIPVIIVCLLPLAGCGEDDEFAVRPYGLEQDGRWVGNAVCYGPHRDGQRPGGPSPSAAEIREDLRLMVPHWNLLRIYGSS